MIQDQCLSLPSHFTHLGVCYPGSSASITLSDPNHPQPANFHVTSAPEPSTASLFALALVMGLVSLRIPSAERLIYSSRIGIDLWRRLCGGISNDDEEHPVMRNSDDGHERSSQRRIDYVRLQGRRYLRRFVRGHRLWQFHVR